MWTLATKAFSNFKRAAVVATPCVSKLTREQLQELLSDRRKDTDTATTKVQLSIRPDETTE
jgi:hypothetical protein